ncbi:MAG: DMT family transporter [Pseudomonadota bacterium]
MTPALRGAFMIVVASMFIAATTMMAKMLGSSDPAVNITNSAMALSPFQIAWGRFAFALLALLIVIAIKRPAMAGFHPKLHAGRVAFGASGVTAMFAAATLIPLADATAITFLNPVIAMVLAVLFLREKVGPIRWSMAALAFLGTLLLVRPATSAFQPDALVALLAAVLLGAEILFLKRLSDREPTVQILLVANTCGFLLMSMAMLWFWQSPSVEQWVLLIAIGPTMLMAQSLFTPALRLGDASFIVPFSYSVLIFAAIYDVLFFGTVPVPLSLLGSAIILVSGVILAWREGRVQKRQNRLG